MKIKEKVEGARRVVLNELDEGIPTGMTLDEHDEADEHVEEDSAVVSKSKPERKTKQQRRKAEKQRAEVFQTFVFNLRSLRFLRNEHSRKNLRSANYIRQLRW